MTLSQTVAGHCTEI